MQKDEVIALINETYEWFNTISNPLNPFDIADLQKRFEPNFIVEMNDEFIIKDYASFFNHFNDFRNSGSSIKIHLPLQEIVVSDDKCKCVARYNITKICEDTRSCLKVMTIWHISENKRLKRMNQVVYEEAEGGSAQFS